MDFDPADRIDELVGAISAAVTAAEELRNEAPLGIRLDTIDALLAVLEEAKRIASDLEEQKESK